MLDSDDAPPAARAVALFHQRSSAEAALRDDPATPRSEHDARRDDVVFGATMAVGSFTDAMHRHCTAPLELFQDPLEYAATRRSVQALSDAEPSRRLSVRSLGQLRPGSVDPKVWHDINADVVRPFLIRERFGRRPYPITVTHHTVSYAAMLNDWFQAMVLGAWRPYDALVCTSEAVKDAIERTLHRVAEQTEARLGVSRRFGGQLPVIPLGVDTEALRPIERAEARARLGIGEDEFVLLWLGRLSVSDKADLLPLLRAARSVLSSRPGRLIIAGSDVGRTGQILRTYARELGIGDQVTVRRVDGDERRWLYGAADVFVAPTDNLQESFGLTPVEAMATGTPQVVADWDGYRHTVVDGETGFLIPTYWAKVDDDVRDLARVVAWRYEHLLMAQSVAVDYERLAAAIEQLAANPELRRRMSEASRRRAVQVYDWSVVIAQYEALWERLSQQAAREKRDHPMSPVIPPAYCHDYAGYPSVMLGDDATVIRTRDGERILDGELGLPCYYEVVEAFDSEVALALLRAMAEPVRLDALGRAASLRELSPPSLRRHALWLLKYGFARVEGGR